METLCQYPWMSSQQCVTIVTKARWEMQCEALTTDKICRPRHVKRLKLGTHDWVEMDGTGRILVPKTLRTMAEIERDALINGIGTRLELWNRDLFSKYYASIRERSQAERQRRRHANHVCKQNNSMLTTCD